MRGPCHGYGASVAVTWLTAFLDTAAPEAAATEAYWVVVTGWPLSPRRGENGEFASLQPSDGDGPVRVQVVGTQPPGGMHLDVHTDDVDRQVEQARGLGAEMRDTGLGYAVGRSAGRVGRASSTRSALTSRRRPSTGRRSSGRG